jgi:hypothetical protein
LPLLSQIATAADRPAPGIIPRHALFAGPKMPRRRQEKICRIAVYEKFPSSIKNKFQASRFTGSLAYLSAKIAEGLREKTPALITNA